MERNEFIKIVGLTAIGLGLIPSSVYALTQNRFTRNQLIGKDDINIIGSSYTTKMHRDTAVAFQKMKTEAAKEGFEIELVSAYRSFERQKEIFEGKYQQYLNQGLMPLQAIKKIIEYSTIPGTSRHHWGTDIDIIDANAPRPKSVLQPEHFQDNGPFYNLKNWLNEHAEGFGFYEVYTNTKNRKGFKYEPWHFSYAAVSIPMLMEFKELDLKKILLEEKIDGAEFFTNDFIKQYRTENILDINPQLL
jgi:LAS superfamily LD-carboxypeptidase LdcB